MHPERLARVFDVIGRIARMERPPLSELSRGLGLPVSSMHNLLTALVAIDLVSAAERRYELPPRAFALGPRISDSVDVRRVARPHLSFELRATGERIERALVESPAANAA
jgi:DNA-binding IclR family transcriptional regulator